MDIGSNFDACRKTNDDTLIKFDSEIGFDALLSKYGPEGLYLIAGKLRQVADADVAQALAEIEVFGQDRMGGA
jgi:hypothetical protein